MTKPVIQVRDLRKSYPKNQVLDGVSLEVKPGQVFALLGANGAGKTTTINILTTLLTADGGSATVAGFDVAARPGEVRRRISVTGQFAAVDEILTGRENLELIARLRHEAAPAKVASGLLKQFGLSDAADRRVQTYSGGMRRRLDIAMSLIGRPAVIFLDEPTTGLDPESRGAMWQTIRDLADSGTTVFLTTQYLDEADRLADHIAVLHRGRIVASGTAVELKRTLPGGVIQISFADDGQLRRAAQLFGASAAADGLTLTLATDGRVAQLAAVAAKLSEAGIEPTELTRTTPTLDDVFLRLVGQKENQA